MCLALAALAAPPFLDTDATLSSMATDSARHPLCVFRVVPYRGVEDQARSAPLIENQDASQFFSPARQMDQRVITVKSKPDDARCPDILVVVVESFRRELVNADVMPNLATYAQNGIHCQSHFSGGNATNHGMFSLLNGLEANWYQRPVTYAPLMNRLFHTAGYEIGFFAGHNDWRLFLMDGFIDPKHYDVFESYPANGLLSDRRATEAAIRFLNRHDQAARDSKPRMAVLYLYATHAIYQSYGDDQIFHPAADDRLTYPYPQTMREQVWNRYKNGARTVDRFLGAVMQDDCVVLVTGDHGESFLDDGTIGHGIRISEFQNMTSAVLHGPGIEPQTLLSPTSHMDLLPTLLDVVGIRVTHPYVFDGVSLHSTSESIRSGRVFATRNYLDRDLALIGPWTMQADAPFAYRLRVDKAQRKLLPLNAIDHSGFDSEQGSAEQFHDAIAQWSRARGHSN